MLLVGFRNFIGARTPVQKLENGTTNTSITNIMGFDNMITRVYGGSPCDYNYTTGGSASTGLHWFVAVGRGDTEPTFDDYALADKARELTWLHGSATVNTGNTIWSVTNTFRNDTSAPITIKEIGLGIYPNQNADNYGVYLARSILETPVTIGVGETYSFTYNIEV